MFAKISVLVFAASIALAVPKPGDGVKFSNLKDGQTIDENFVAKFAVTGKKVVPVKESSVTDREAGHFHLILDAGSTPTGTVIPADPTHIHFGAGQVEAPLKLSKGDHTVTLQFADAAHVSYGPQWASTVKVHVK